MHLSFFFSCVLTAIVSHVSRCTALNVIFHADSLRATDTFVLRPNLSFS